MIERPGLAGKGGGATQGGPPGAEGAPARWTCECRDCGAVFEADREESNCPECASEDVMGMSGWENAGI